MDFTDIQISNEQARQFAKAIYTDVIEYIKNHQEKYNEFSNNKKSN